MWFRGRPGAVFFLFAVVVCLGPFTAAQENAAPAGRPQFAQREDEIRAVPDGQLVLDVVVPGAAKAPPYRQEDFAVYDNGKPVPNVPFSITDSRSDDPARIMFVIDALAMDAIDIERSKQAIGAYLQRDGGRLHNPVSVVSLEKNIGKSERARAAMVKPLGKGSGFLRLIPYSMDGNALNTALQKENIFYPPLLDMQGGPASAMRMSLSLEAMGLIADAESHVTGHKLLIWLTPGWQVPPVATAADQRQSNAEAAYMTTVLEQARMTVYNVNPSSQSFHGAIDPAAGFSAISPSARTVVSTQGAESAVTPPAAPGGSNKSRYFGDVSLQSIALRSGGLIFAPGGDLAAEIRQCVADAGTFYTFTLTPEGAREKDTFHRIGVTLKGETGRTRTVSGYFWQPGAITGK